MTDSIHAFDLMWMTALLCFVIIFVGTRIAIAVNHLTLEIRAARTAPKEGKRD